MPVRPAPTQLTTHSKFKIPQYQNGQAYLTSHRACYVDHAEPRQNSVAIFLRDVERTEFYVRYVFSSFGGRVATSV